jgi:DNA-binding transcriptional ArsR family regulator
MRAMEVQEQLDSLRKEIREMSHILQRIQEEDVRRVYGEQIRSIMVERARHFFQSERGRPDGGDDGWLTKVEEMTFGLIEETVSAFQLVDHDRALAILEANASRPWPPGSRDSALRCRAFVDDVVEQFKNYFNITIGWRGQIGLVGQIPPTDIGTTPSPPSPDLVERVLSPLSNSIRFGMISSLRVKAQSITELSREMGLQKGHLQFHLKVLFDAGYVALDRRTHLYSLTKKGETALKGVTELVISMEMLAT